MSLIFQKFCRRALLCWTKTTLGHAWGGWCVTHKTLKHQNTVCRKAVKKRTTTLLSASFQRMAQHADESRSARNVCNRWEKNKSQKTASYEIYCLNLTRALTFENFCQGDYTVDTSLARSGSRDVVESGVQTAGAGQSGGAVAAHLSGACLGVLVSANSSAAHDEEGGWSVASTAVAGGVCDVGGMARVR
jgi:hypothetical protein